MVGIVLADDEPIIRQGFLTIDWEKEGMELLGIGSNGIETLDLVRKHKPNILLTDIRMPGMNGLDLVRTVKHEFPEIKIILLTAYHEFDYAVSAIKFGATAFVLKPSDPEEIIDVCHKAKALIEDEQLREQKEQSLLKQVKAYKLSIQDKLLSENSEGPSHEVIDKVLEYMETHYADEITMTVMAEHVHLNPVYLSRLIKKETGETFSDILVRIRLNQAMELMKDPNIRVYEISDKIGIKDARYFGQLFKKHYGMTPKEFRNQLIEKQRKG
jgi:two-component system response regulator YesN